MCRHMTGGVDGVTGSMTSGGTESILMAVKSARDHARAVRGIADPECVLPLSAHPAFAKAGHYLGVKMVWVPSHPNTKAANVEAMAAAMNSRTCLIVGSAPQYPHGVLDPISQLAALAVSKGVLMHVDACFGGFVLPWLRAAGFEHPDWDFRVPGVTSISMDVHKYVDLFTGRMCSFGRRSLGCIETRRSCVVPTSLPDVSTAILTLLLCATTGTDLASREHPA
jgi:glutamate/tyrosine decarboxylase-like PLP-dependent enzyme